MRLLAELILIAALIGVAWEKPYHEWVGEAVPLLAKQSAPAEKAGVRRALPARGVALPTPAPTISSGSWMWDKTHKSPLDPPKHEHASPQPTP